MAVGWGGKGRGCRAVDEEAGGFERPKQAKEKIGAGRDMPSSKKRKLENGLVRDPLYNVPETLEEITTEANFTVGDLAIVLKLMNDMFGIEYSFCGPSEGSIKITKQDGKDPDFSLWLGKRHPSHPCAGDANELRLCGSSGDDNLVALDILFLNLCHENSRELKGLERRRPNPDVKITDTHEEAVEKLIGMCPLFGRKRFESDDMRRVLSNPFKLKLRACYPKYTWPRWMFGAFEGLVMRRVQVTTAQKAGPPA